MSNLSDREQKILDYMKEYVTKWGYPPTVRDIAAALGIRSTSTVHKAIASLEAYGMDVYKTACSAGLKYVNGPNTITYFGMVLFAEDEDA